MRAAPRSAFAAPPARPAGPVGPVRIGPGDTIEKAGGNRAILSPSGTAAIRGHSVRRILHRSGAATVVVLAAAGLLAANSPPPAAGGAPAAAALGCILISIDTLRADHLGAYGYGLPTSPEIDGFRRDAVLFSAAIAQAPSTLASHASMLTSLLVPQHGASFKLGTALAPEVTTLAEILREHGIHTLSFNEGGQIAPRSGLGRGFNHYRSTPIGPGSSSLASEVGRAAAWLRSHRGQPFFLFLHTYQVHHPYTPDPRHLAMVEAAAYRGLLPAGETPLAVLDAVNQGQLALARADLRHIVATYDAQVRAMDDGFGELIAFLKEQGLYDRTTIVFTSDHGEEFGEHGRVGWHSHTLYDELLRVPLLIKYPSGAHAGETVRRQVRVVDVAPTVLASLAVAPPAGLQGLDLTPLVRGRPEPARLAVSNLDGGGVASIRTLRWKLVGNHLFDLARDPGETRDVSSRYGEIAAYLGGRRQALLAAAPSHAGPRVDLAGEDAASLRSLGYAAAGPARPPLTATGASAAGSAAAGREARHPPSAGRSSRSRPSPGSGSAGAATGSD
jgi:arylsulfatase A-like enzyme